MDEKSGYRQVMSYDDILDQIGEFGKFQAISIAILWVTALTPGIHVLMHAITGFQSSNGFRCKVEGCDTSDWTYQDNVDLSYGGDNCKYFIPVINQTNNICTRNPKDETIACPSNSDFTFNSFEFDKTFVTRFNLVCEDEFKVSLVGSIYMVGLMIGSSTTGYISDHYGRRWALLFCITLSTISSFVGAFMPDYWSYLALRFLTACGAVGLFNESFTLTVELLGSKQLSTLFPWITVGTVHGNTIQIPYAIGGALLGVAALFIKDYITLQWVLSACMAIQFPLWFLIPESPRWLISKGKEAEAKQLITKIATMNKQKICLDNVDLMASGGEEKTETETQLGFTDLFKTKSIRIYTIVMLLNWPIISLGYFGLGLSMTQLGDDKLVSFILGALVEIPGYLLCMLVIDVWGRKPFFISSLMLTGVSCITAGFLEEGTVRTTLALIGKLFAAGNFSVVYMYTAEMYPTIIRNTAVGTFSFAARIGGIIAPFLALYLPNIQKQLPMLIMGGSSIVGGLCAFLLPETLGSKLPENMQDVEEMTKNTKSLWSCVWSKRKGDQLQKDEE